MPKTIKPKQEKIKEGVTLDELLDSVEELYQMAEKDKKSEIILGTATEKWVESSSHAY